MSWMSISPPPNRRLIKTALHQAVLDGRLHQVRLLVAKHIANVDCKDMYGRTPLMLSALVDESVGHKMARIFIKAGAALNLRDNMGRTALAYACMNGHEMVVDEILREDVLNISEQDNDGNSPLHHAAMSGNPNVVAILSEYFVKFGLDIDARNKLGYSPLLLSCKYGHFSAAYTLLTKGKASPVIRDGESYLNASEWALKNDEHKFILPIRRLLSSPHVNPTLSFSRESTIYQRTPSPSARTQNLPPIHSSAGPGDNKLLLFRSETFIDGKEARQKVLNVIDNIEAQNRPLTTKPVRSKFHHPPTAKLLALTRRSKTVIPTMETIFKAYSDQYQPGWPRKPRTSISAQLIRPSVSHIKSPRNAVEVSM
ncbi:hypothetical protein CHS0354_019427 [Potamilus streckersoni]|uniref:Uncharacterized protein n=1 Tax=Potamilus streckersoni TaxID=2493646 RepID=A0AAE0VVF5_9BIVA|nr:hypothetical protein CHS0354_019427 [Potamilus streckersoni]